MLLDISCKCSIKWQDVLIILSQEGDGAYLKGDTCLKGAGAYNSGQTKTFALRMTLTCLSQTNETCNINIKTKLRSKVHCVSFSNNEMCVYFGGGGGTLGIFGIFFIRLQIKNMYVCMYVCTFVTLEPISRFEKA